MYLLRTVGRRSVDDEIGEKDDEGEVQGQGDVVDVATEAVPLVANQSHAQGVAEEILRIYAIL